MLETATLRGQLKDLPHLLDLFELWYSKLEGREMPAWSDFDSIELKRWLGNLNLVEVVRTADRVRFRYKVFGSNLIYPTTDELTGKFLDEGLMFIVQQVMPTYEQLVKTRQPRYHIHDDRSSPQLFRHHRLVLPLSDDGRDVTHALVGAYPIEVPGA